MEKRCGCSLLVQRSFLDLRISARISDTGRPRVTFKLINFIMIGKYYWANKKEMDQEGVAGNGPDCLSIANGAQAAHVTGTPNVYRMDRSVFQVLQERSPACQDCRCGKRPCARHTSSSSCATFFARNARVWRQYQKNDLRHDLCILFLKQNKVTKQCYATRTDIPEATEHIAAFPICFWYCLEW
ncbi:hypothetical protein ALC53_12405 [Atta colombica]|uniref:Uncharacterized protein n=1 Tax=Atta colombica TaxID=520822 RepID=A0A195AYJ1_9HYME|nr:hypothetical protein ALC53_12405 [Atta colombica]